MEGLLLRVKLFWKVAASFREVKDIVLDVKVIIRKAIFWKVEAIF